MSSAVGVIGIVLVLILIAAPVSGKRGDRFGRTRVVGVALWLYGIGLLVPFFTQSPYLVLPILPFGGYRPRPSGSRAAILDAPAHLGVKLDVDVHPAQLLYVEIVPAPRQLGGQRGQVAECQLGDLLLDLRGVGVVLNEEPVPGGGEDLAGAVSELERELEAQDERLASLVFRHPLLPRLVAGRSLGPGVRERGGRVIQDRPGRESLHAGHGVRFTPRRPPRPANGSQADRPSVAPGWDE